MKKLTLIAALVFCTVAAFAQQGKLVVTPFENRGSRLDAAALNNLYDFLINAFINTKRFQVPDRNALDLLAKEQNFQVSDWADDAKSAQMGKVLNADYIVRIIALHDGEENMLMARILDVKTAHGLSAHEMEFSDQRDARAKLNGFVGEILQRIGGPAGKPQGKLVVTPFENRGSRLDAAALNNLQDFLINAFINNGQYQVPDRSALALLATEQQFQLSDWADDTKSAQMGKVLNADYIARVIIIPDETANILMVRILDVNTANGLSAAEMDFTTQRDARGKMEIFVDKLLPRIGGSSGTRPASTPEPSPPPVKTVKSNGSFETVPSILPHFIGVGSTFSTPLVTLSIYNHLPIISSEYSGAGCLIDYGCDFGLIHAMSEIKDVNYYSFYPNAHINLKAGLGENKESNNMYYFHLGIGAGYMLSTYKFPNDTVQVNTLALDAATGFKINYIHLLYNVRTTFQRVNHKLTVGFYIPY